MLKGRANTVDLYKQNPLSATEKQNVSPRQDSLLSPKNTPSDTQSYTPQVSQGSSIANVSKKNIDSLFASAENREKQITRKFSSQNLKADSVITQTDSLSENTTQLNSSLPFSNSIWHLPETFLFQNNTTTYIYKDSSNYVGNYSQTSITHQSGVNNDAYFKGNIRVESNINWLILTVLTSLFIFSWIKSTYEKFITQIISGIVNYQVSVRLFHERNILFRNVSYALHATFYLNIGLFVFFLIENTKNTQLFPNNFLSMLTYSIAFFILYSIKLLSGKIISHIFLFREEFAEYIHNVFLFNKNIGLLLFPIIIIYPFTIEKFKPLLIYAGVILIIIMLLLRMYRGFQIIIRKGVNLFYMILYLCAVEILPVLLLVKFFNTLI